jgi:hypothetical protein
MDEGAMSSCQRPPISFRMTNNAVAYELWDYAEILDLDKRARSASDVGTVIDKPVIGQSTYFELLWEQLPPRQRATLQALAYRGPSQIYSQAVGEEFRLGPAPSVQKSLQSLDARDVLDRHRGEYFFLDPLLVLNRLRLDGQGLLRPADQVDPFAVGSNQPLVDGCCYGDRLRACTRFCRPTAKSRLPEPPGSGVLDSFLKRKSTVGLSLSDARTPSACIAGLLRALQRCCRWFARLACIR